MRFKWNRLGLATLSLACLTGAGCGGIRTGVGVSPATFLLPGLVQRDASPSPAPALEADQPEPGALVASAR